MTKFRNPYDPIFALDLGTTKFCLATLDPKKTSEATSLLSTNQGFQKVSINAQGMHRGMLANYNQAKDALNNLIDLAEKEFKRPVDHVIVGIAGSHLQAREITCETKISRDQVTNQTLQVLSHIALKKDICQSKNQLHTIPLRFQIDEREWTQEPLNFSGHKLKGRFFRIEANKAYVHDVVKLCNQCGLTVTNILAEPFASAQINLTDKAKEFGVAIVDIGGGTTDGLIFFQGMPVRLFTINIGGILMTNDIALGLGVPMESAEHLKRELGLKIGKSETPFIIDSIDGQRNQVSGLNIEQILKARVVELAVLIEKQLSSCSIPLHSGLVITGGGSEVAGIENLFQQVLQLPVKKSRPNFNLKMAANCNPYLLEELLRANSDAESTPFACRYSTVAGMILIELNSRLKDLPAEDKGFMSSFKRKLVSWVKELS